MTEIGAFCALNDVVTAHMKRPKATLGADAALHSAALKAMGMDGQQVAELNPGDTFTFRNERYRVETTLRKRIRCVQISSYCCFGPFHVSSNHVIQRTEGSDFSHRFDQFLKRGFPLNSMRANFSAKSYVGVKVRKFMQERKQEKWWRKVFIDRNNGAFESEITPF